MDERSSTGRSGATMPLEPGAFPRTGVNSLAPTGARPGPVLDALVLGVPYLLVLSLIGLVISGADQSEPPALSCADLDPVPGPAISLAIVYEMVCTTLWGQTVGKLAFGLRVARLSNGRCPLSVGVGPADRPPRSGRHHPLPRRPRRGHHPVRGGRLRRHPSQRAGPGRRHRRRPHPLTPPGEPHHPRRCSDPGRLAPASAAVPVGATR